jgi:hypothetical protein
MGSATTPSKGTVSMGSASITMAVTITIAIPMTIPITITIAIELY